MYRLTQPTEHSMKNPSKLTIHFGISKQNPCSNGRRRIKQSLPVVFLDNNNMKGSFANGDVAWFLNGELNVSYNCVVCRSN